MFTITPSIRQIVAVSIACSLLAAPRLIFAEQGWSPVHTGKHTDPQASGEQTARQTTAVRRVSYQVLPPSPAPAQRLWAPSRPQRHATADRNAHCCIYNLFDGVAGGIEHVLGLSGPLASAHCDSANCDSANCDDLGCDANDALWPTSQPIIVSQPPASQSFARPRTRDDRLPHSVPALTDPSGEDQPGTTPALPAPQVPDQLVDPFEDDQAWTPGRDASISPSAYFDPGSSTLSSEPLK